MKLIPEWRSAWRMFSVQAPAVAMAAIGGWQATPDDLRMLVPTWAAVSLLCVILVGGIFGRIIDQPSIPDPTKKEESES